MRTVVEWFGNLSFDQQKSALGQIQQAHEHSRSDRRAELEKQLAALGYGVAKRGGVLERTGNGSANGGALKKVRNSSVKAKYRNPKTKETWSGRGRMASWLKSKQDAGEKIDKYLV